MGDFEVSCCSNALFEVCSQREDQAHKSKAFKGVHVRYLVFAVLLFISSASSQKIQKSAVQVSDLVQILGRFEALEINFPKEARSYILATPGARLSGSTDAGTKRLVAGISSFALQTCQDKTKMGIFIALGDASSSWSCIGRPETGVSPAFRSVRLAGSQKEATVVLNRWTPLWAYIPNLKTFSNGVEVSHPSGWLLWQIYLSDSDLINLKDIADPPVYGSGDITLL